MQPKVLSVAEAGHTVADGVCHIDILVACGCEWLLARRNASSTSDLLSKTFQDL